MRNFRAFTLIEVMVCMILTAIVAFFIYTMMLSAHRTYFKLFSVSRQRNDVRYFETLIKKSIANAQGYEVNGNKLIFKYYDTSTNKYRVDEYDCGSALASDATGSNINSLLGKSNMEIKSSYSGTNGTDIRLTSKQGASYGSGTTLINNEIVMKNINKVFFYIKQPYPHHNVPVFELAVVYNRTLDDGEENYEYMFFSVSMRNLFYSGGAPFEEYYNII